MAQGGLAVQFSVGLQSSLIVACRLSAVTRQMLARRAIGWRLNAAQHHWREFLPHVVCEELGCAAFR
ncbi:hypothetical protein ASD64_19560 [Mesorhizobium sp. Root157]|nr:hypothetical protein ASD64_19560 [Mesorhizobium sp. Root157]